MTRSALDAAFLTVAVFASACGISSTSDAPASAPPPGSLAESLAHAPASSIDDARPAIATRVTNDARVTLLGRSHAKVVVRGPNGEPVEKTMAIADLKAVSPELYDLVTGARATGLDARLYRGDLPGASAR
jgi:hypothetical protein